LTAKNSGRGVTWRHAIFPRWSGASLAGLALFFCTTGCAGGKPAAPPTTLLAAQPAMLPGATQAGIALSGALSLENELRGKVNFWLGTPYKLGGSSRRGIDCSGFVQQIVRDVFAIELPRTAKEQARCGADVAPSELSPGDLLVFKIRGVRHHVGIYLGSGKFAHASRRKGITIATLSESYWRRAFRAARRLTSG